MNENIKILIAEDERIIAYDLSKIMQKYGFTNIILANNGKEVVKKSKSDNPDILLMDILMDNEIDGIEAAKKIIKDKKKKLIIFVTASTDEATYSRAMKIRPIDIVIKPFTEHRIIDAVRRAVAKLNIKK